MSDLFYRAVRAVGRPIIGFASQTRVLHAERVPRAGPFLLVANHQSIFDAVLLVASTPRIVRWLSSHDIFLKPLGKWFFTGMQALPLDRAHHDAHAVRAVVRSLRAGYMVGIFPQGAVRAGTELVAREGRMPETLARLVQVARVPIVPCVILGGAKFRQWPAWLPLHRTHWAVAYGAPVALRPELEPAAARQALLDDLAHALLTLYDEVCPHV